MSQLNRSRTDVEGYGNMLYVYESFVLWTELDQYIQIVNNTI